MVHYIMNCLHIVVEVFPSSFSVTVSVGLNWVFKYACPTVGETSTINIAKAAYEVSVHCRSLEIDVLILIQDDSAASTKC